MEFMNNFAKVAKVPLWTQKEVNFCTLQTLVAYVKKACVAMKQSDSIQLNDSKGVFAKIVHSYKYVYYFFKNVPS